MKKIYLIMCFLLTSSLLTAEENKQEEVIKEKPINNLKTSITLGFGALSSKSSITAYLTTQDEDLLKALDVNVDSKNVKKTVRNNILNLELSSNFLTYNNPNFTKNIKLGVQFQYQNALFVFIPEGFEVANNNYIFMLTSDYEHFLFKNYISIYSGLGLGFYVNYYNSQLKFKAYDFNKTKNSVGLAVSPRIGAKFSINNFSLVLSYNYISIKDLQTNRIEESYLTKTKEVKTALPKLKITGFSSINVALSYSL